MAVLDFPIGPSINDRFPNPAIAGQPQYVWDGEKWTTVAAGVTSATPAAATPLEDNATPQVGVTTKYAREDHVHPSTALKYSAQTLTTAQAAQSRTNLYAAPFDAQAYSGIQINGSMEVSQERGTTGVSIDTAYICDGWKFGKLGTAAVTAAQYAYGAAGFNNILALTVSTAQASMGAGDYVTIIQPVEGYRLARLGWGAAGAQPITIGFHTRHVRTGTYSGAVRTPTGSRSYTFTYTQNVSDILEYKTVTIPGDVTGTWPRDNTNGMYIGFAVAAGANVTAPAANTWYGANYQAAPGQVNGVAATSDIFRITGVVVIPGIEAPSAERSALIMRPYDQELQLCRRYWQLIMPDIRGGGSPATVYEFTYPLPVEMRALPTVTQVAAGTVSPNAVSYTMGVLSFREIRPTLLVNNTADAFVNGRTFSLDARL